MRNFSETKAHDAQVDSGEGPGIRPLREIAGQAVLITQVSIEQTQYGEKARFRLTLEMSGEQVICYSGDTRIKNQARALMEDWNGEPVRAQLYEGDRNQFGKTFIWWGDVPELKLIAQQEAEDLARKAGMYQSQWKRLGEKHQWDWSAMVMELRNKAKTAPSA